jgi:hypothetical protein
MIFVFCYITVKLRLNKVCLPVLHLQSIYLFGYLAVANSSGNSIEKLLMNYLLLEH